MKKVAKKLRVHIIGALILSVLPAQGVFAFKKRKSFDCQSDAKISDSKRRLNQTSPEYTAQVTASDDDKKVQFVVKKSSLYKNKIHVETLTNEFATIDVSDDRYLNIQGKEWALAIAPEKKRASLYNMDPDINEIPMFCLSQ